jgi:hypothetical protein
MFVAFFGFDDAYNFAAHVADVYNIHPVNRPRQTIVQTRSDARLYDSPKAAHYSKLAWRNDIDACSKIYRDGEPCQTRENTARLKTTEGGAQVVQWGFAVAFEDAK